MDNLLQVKTRSNLYALQKLSVDELVYCIKDNTFYHLKDISRSNKPDGWEQVAAIPKKTITITTPVELPTDYLNKETADSYYIKRPINSVNREILIWDGIVGEKVKTTSGASINEDGHICGGADIIAYSAGTPPTIPPFNFRCSLTSSESNVNLLNDLDTPGNNKVYGTNDVGVKGWVSVPAAAGGVSSQWTTAGSDIYFSGGKVGVGASNPTAKLQVEGSDSTTHGTGAAIRIINTAAGGGDWTIRSGATGSFPGAGVLSFGDAIGYKFVITPSYTRIQYSASADLAKYFLELYSDNSGNPADYISLRFHHSTQVWGCVRYNNTGFRLTGGNSDTVVSLAIASLNASGTGYFSDQVTIGAYHATTRLRFGSDDNQYISYEGAAADRIYIVGYQGVRLQNGYTAANLILGNSSVSSNVSIISSADVIAYSA